MTEVMSLTIQLPSRIFLDQKRVVRIAAESNRGCFSILPRRLDCLAALRPGILVYELEKGREFHVAVDKGVLVKSGFEVYVSVHNAIGDVPLEKLASVVQEQLKVTDEQEIALRNSISLLQGSLIGSFKRGK